MLEIERKILNINLEEITQKLINLGASKNFSSKINTFYFDYPDLRFKNQDQLLRVRQIGEKVEVCFKFDRSNKGNTRTYKEKEFLSDANQLDDIIDFFTSLGFVQSFFFEKHRTEYIVNNTEIDGTYIQQAKFELDTYPHLDPFLEIESDSSQTIDLLVQKLDLEKHEQTNETINELFLRLNPHLNLNGLKLK
jgi:adenylate cyclase class 2